MIDQHEHYLKNGVTEIISVFDVSKLFDIQNLIYENTKHLIVDHEFDKAKIDEILRLPFKVNPSSEDFSRLMNEVNNSQELAKLISAEEVKITFKKILGSEKILAFPISKFRAQFPKIERSTYNWHQDEGTWYAVKVKDLAHKMPGTLWLSINGANTGNSIEIIPKSHVGKLENHKNVEGQGYFNAEVPRQYLSEKSILVECSSGQGIAFHPLTFHRSIQATSGAPRYSVDIRYYSEESLMDGNYKTDWRFKLKRVFN